jgi:hypothetical protein
MTIGHGKRVNDLNIVHFKRLAEDCDLGWPMIRERVEALADKTAAIVAGEQEKKHPSTGADMEAGILDRILKRCQRIHC